MRIIALEESCIRNLLELYPASYASSLSLVDRRRTDVGRGRIRRMDSAGIDFQVRGARSQSSGRDPIIPYSFDLGTEREGQIEAQTGVTGSLVR
jgi:hypothetical protein